MRALASDGVVAGWVCLKLEPSQLLIACPAGNVQALFWLAVFLFTRVIPIRSTAASDLHIWRECQKMQGTFLAMPPRAKTVLTLGHFLSSIWLDLGFQLV